MSRQIITTPGGERLVLMPESKFLAMQEALEDREDVSTVKAFEQDLAAGKAELIPAEFVDRLVDGENPIRVWRDYRGIKAVELAKTVGISQSHISSIETGQREPSVTLLKKLAEALNVDMDDLVA